jgi:hypothetical protein
MKALKVFACLLAGTVVAAAAPPIRLTWAQLPQVTGKEARIAMPGGAVVGGRVASVESDALIMDVRSTTDGAKFPKGELRVPRATLKALELRTRTKRYRVIGTTVGCVGGMMAGALAGFAAGGGILSNDHNTRAVAVAVSIWGGGTAGGYLLGRAADGQTTMVLIEPE